MSRIHSCRVLEEGGGVKTAGKLWSIQGTLSLWKASLPRRSQSDIKKEDKPVLVKALAWIEGCCHTKLYAVRSLYMLTVGMNIMVILGFQSFLWTVYSTHQWLKTNKLGPRVWIYFAFSLIHIELKIIHANSYIHSPQTFSNWCLLTWQAEWLLEKSFVYRA